ncbi:hypothetical protein [Paraclostridium sordellii]|uniref:hypothetical protein n=1 Tax=Paraclostridium sordellii TaxID=1505 RepID=UPI0005EA5129|nr:hypothetical protein [Paeniclostridium sordellii]CEN92926.1 Uncharacterised protein [[Clostridium] sordellii] [Paeniclostridium sordellii]CEN96083.1 Uncharacterised protein [[Clostridium] sordellii] [Paeniclostridium sordellii]CEQ11902.1 Uncharacterised protein [[Clostridium] sordellii] [Paeniclostridium sordellii]
MYKIIVNLSCLVIFAYMLFNTNLTTFSNIVGILAIIAIICSLFTNIKIFYKEKN